MERNALGPCKEAAALGQIQDIAEQRASAGSEQLDHCVDDVEQVAIDIQVLQHALAQQDRRAVGPYGPLHGRVVAGKPANQLFGRTWDVGQQR